MLKHAPPRDGAGAIKHGAFALVWGEDGSSPARRSFPSRTADDRRGIPGARPGAGHPGSRCRDHMRSRRAPELSGI
jgi:hypothetical protein